MGNGKKMAAQRAYGVSEELVDHVTIWLLKMPKTCTHYERVPSYEFWTFKKQLASQRRMRFYKREF